MTAILNTLTTDTLPVDTLPVDTLTTDTLPVDTLTTDTLPVDTLTTDTLPVITRTDEGSLKWTTKKGAQKYAHSEASQSRAPRAVRLSDADAKTLEALRNGQYRPFLRDVLASLNENQREYLESHIKGEMTVTVDGALMVPLNPLSQCNKPLMLALNQHLHYALSYKKTKHGGISTGIPPKSKQYLVDILTKWSEA